MELKDLASMIMEKVGGVSNVESVTHCMTRLRFVLNDVDKAKGDELKAIDEIMGVVYKGGQYQLIVGPTVGDLYDMILSLYPDLGKTEEKEEVKAKEETKEKGWKGVINNIFGTLAGCMTPLIPILLVCGLSKTIVAIFGPQLLNLISTKNDLYILFTVVGDAGFYFMPILVGYTASKKMGCNEIIGMLMGAILIHPTFISLSAAKSTAFSVYGIPTVMQNYSNTIIPIILTVWIMSYVEGFFKKHTPDTLKVFGVPFGTVLVMLPLALCVFGPLGSYMGKYICNGIIALHNVAGPFAIAIVAATFSLLVLTGMHTILIAFLFVSFPTMGYDPFLMPAILCCSWAGAGVTTACFLKFKDKRKKELTAGYFFTWLFGGVGEPMLYGLQLPYKTPFYANMIAGAISGFICGILGLKAYVLNPSNGIYGIAAFLGGPNSNYIVLGIVLAVSVVSGFLAMWFMKLDENLA